MPTKERVPEKSSKNAAGSRIVLGLCIAIVMFALAGSLYTSEKACKALINYQLDLHKGEVAHNYVLFVDKSGGVLGNISEENNFLLVELLLARALNKPDSDHLQFYLESIGWHDLYGWWDEGTLQQGGKQYFKNKPLLFLHYDAMDTAAAYKLQQRLVTDTQVSKFLSNEPLPPRFAKLCYRMSCTRELVVRVWSDEDWHDEIDLVVSADLITALNRSSPLGKKVFRENSRIINYAIEEDDIDRHFKYFDPKITGHVSLLMMDDHVPFLSSKARQKLLMKVQEDYKLLDGLLESRWGGGNEYFYGCNLVSVNSHITKLMKEYAEEHWKEALFK